mmetsp:Transcript_21397/g.27194  ORF Transcript_21397/g.27194 Transcript_21397/m.27194 type:complete len:101 (+) Transcript_21397:1600-1902(+)
MSDVDNVTDSPRETRSGVPLSSPLPKTIQKPEVRRPRRWKKKWVKVSHMQLLKWVPEKREALLSDLKDDDDENVQFNENAPVTRSITAALAQTDKGENSE